MAKRVFFSFYYKEDNQRASLVRNMGVIEGNPLVSDNEWEKITSGGDEAIKEWIDEQLFGRSCAIVLIGQNTAGRKWINYEIKRAWEKDKGLLGIYIHNLKDLNGEQSSKGRNPFEDFTLNGGTAQAINLSLVVEAHNPPYTESKDVYSYIEDNIENWIDRAVEIRENHD
jgi:hypothetical protein